MSSKKTFSLLLALFGEALIIFFFLYFFKNTQIEVLILNIFVSTIIYCLLFADLIFPWVNLKDKTQKQIGSIGIRWFFTYSYLILAIGAMVYFNNEKPTHFAYQLMIHGILLFIILLGLFISFSTSEKVSEVYFEEKENRDRIDELKKATKELILKVDSMSNIPSEIKTRINELQENLRYLSPTNNIESIRIESKFIEEVRALKNCFLDNPLNIEIINDNIKNCERTYKERKQIFSN
jgi:hypothetical protein